MFFFFKKTFFYFWTNVNRTKKVKKNIVYISCLIYNQIKNRGELMQNNVLNDLVVVKRSGQRVSFNGTKIAIAIKSAFDNVESKYTEKDINKVYSNVLKYISNVYNGRKTITVEDIQDIIEEELKANNYNEIFEAFNFYRLRRTASREVFSEKHQHKFVKTIEKLGLQSNFNFYAKPVDVMDGFGKIVLSEFTKAYLLENKYVRAHDEGTIYIHDLESYPLYTTSMAHLNFDSLVSFQIMDYLTNLVDIIRQCKKEQTGEHSINSFDDSHLGCTESSSVNFIILSSTGIVLVIPYSLICSSK